jgi:hypothetical protein
MAVVEPELAVIGSGIRPLKAHSALPDRLDLCPRENETSLVPFE